MTLKSSYQQIAINVVLAYQCREIKIDHTDTDVLLL